METEIKPISVKVDGINNYNMISELCKGAHKVDGKVPELTDLRFDNRTCDCGRLKYVSEDCGCGGQKHKELHGYPNEQ